MSRLVADIPVVLQEKEAMKYLFHRLLKGLFLLFFLLFPTSLFPQIIHLREVAVHPGQGLEIVKRMIAAIPKNYDTSLVTMRAFYKEDIRLAGDTLNYNESELEIKGDQWKVTKAGRKKMFSNPDFQFYNWISNISNAPAGALHEDLIKYANTRYSILNPSYFRYYNYYVDSLLGEQVVIVVVPKNNSKNGFVSGRLFIDTASLALVRCELVASPAGIRHVNKHGRGGIRYTIMSKFIRASMDFEQIQMIVTYQQENGKYYLQDVRRHWETVINSNKRHLKDVAWRADFFLSVKSVSLLKDSLQAVKSLSLQQDAFQSVNSFSLLQDTFQSVKSLSLQQDAFQSVNSFSLLQDTFQSVKSLSLQQDTSRSVKSFSLPQDTFQSIRSFSLKQDTSLSAPHQHFTQADTLRGMLSPLRSCYDVTFYHLDADIDLDRQRISGNNKIRFKVISPFDQMQIDLYANMKINEIIFKNQSLTFTREANAVFVKFPGVQPVGSIEEITIYYEGIPQVPDKSISMNGGVLWDKDDLGNPWAQVVCQGSGASLWWPCKDHLSDEPDSMQIWITVPSGFSEVSNGQLQRQIPISDHKTRFEWAVSYPINNYNVTFSIGKYIHYRDQGVNYYVMPYHLEQAKVYFKEVPAMLSCYEQHFGAYPFPKDSFTLVESLYPMEHQSGVCVGRIPNDPHPEFAFVVWHESAHEWWGNNISCKDMADMWIHEAFATYAESLYIGCRDGEAAAREFLNDQREQVKNNRPVTGVYNVNNIFYDISDMYTKGSLMLFTLQNVINDTSLWNRLLLAIQQHFRYQTLSADELEQFICDFTGNDYHYLFNQYLHYTRVPRLEYSLSEKGTTLMVRYRWVADVPNFRMPVKIKNHELIYPTTEWKTLTLQNQAAADFDIDDENFYIETEEVE
ncbi:M1 family metallopeptidase [Chitinophaga sancti]|uniref:M1 family metallopeptidase n=1 Tax=Chitinophaga sancti TaxID=1004 RepID=UPI002A74A98B|nr:M1 family metallopeptidase [Chitinophaga sancti]WPQ64140.1 M1 family metallopeptidase [Chitinophaga sancti]